MSSYETKAPKIRVDEKFHTYVKKLSSETGLSKVKVTKFLADSLSSAELNILKTPRRRMGFRFDFKI